MKKDRLYDILETMKKNPLKAVLSHFGALSDHSASGPLLAPLGPLILFAPDDVGLKLGAEKVKDAIGAMLQSTVCKNDCFE